MPTQVELSDGRIAEFPDEMSQDDILSALRREFPSEKPSVDLTAAINQPQFEVPYSPGMPYGGAAPIVDQESGSMLGQFWQDINEPMWNIVKPLTEEEHRGLAREPAPLSMPAPSEMVNPFTLPINWGLKQVAEGVPAAVGAAESLGNTVNFFTSPLGISTLGIGALPKAAQRAVALAFSGLMAKGGGEAAGELSVEIAKPPEQRDPAKIGRLVTDVAQATGFSLAGAAPSVKPTARWIENRFFGETAPAPIRLNDPFGTAQEMENRFQAELAAQAGSPFLRLEVPAETISMGVRTQPPLSLSAELSPPVMPGISMEGKPVEFSPTVDIRETFDPSGLRTLEVPSEVQTQFQSVQPPAPPMAPGTRPATATRVIRLQGEAAQRMADFEKSMAEKVSQDQQAKLHPDKPLTENQLRIIQESLTKQILEGQIPGERPGIISGSALEKWADKTLADESWRKNTSMNPFGAAGSAGKNTAAMIVKGAALMERGVVNLAEWTAAMVKEFGRDIEPFLERIRIASEQLKPAQKGGDLNALQREAETVLRDVQQPEVTQEGAGTVPASEGRPPTPEARQENVIEAGGRKYSAQEWSDADFESYNKMIAEQKRLLDSGGIITAEGNFTPEWQELMTKFEALRNLHNGMPPIQISIANELGVEYRGALKAGGKETWSFHDPKTGSNIGIPKGSTFEQARAKIENKRAEFVEESQPKGGVERGLQEKGKEAEVVPSFASKYNPETLMQRPAWVEPGSMLDRVLGDLREKNDPMLVVDVAPIWKTLSPTQRQDLVSRGWTTTILRDPNAVGLKIAQDVVPARTYYGMQAKRALQETQKEVTPTAPVAEAPTLVDWLQSKKLPEVTDAEWLNRGTELMSGLNLPHPEIIKAIGRSTWNSAIDVAIASIKAGKKIAEAIDEAISFLKKNVSGFDEAKARANLQFVTAQETKPAVSPPATEGEVIKMRKSAERATTSPMIPEPVQERIANAPESFYQQQSMRRVEDVVGNLSDADLAGVARDSNIYTASKLEQARRAFDRGDNEAGYRVFEELEKEGTMMGQLINQFKLLKGTRPENIVRVINQTLKKSGKDVLNEKQTGEAMEIAKQSKAADAALDKTTDAWTKEPTPENAAKAEQALLDANAAGLKLQRFISRFSPRTTAGIIKSVLQGNLLTPISEVANLVGNMSFLPFRSMDRTVASAFDVLDNYLKGTKRSITVQPISGTVEAVKGFGRGAKQIPDIFLRGTGDVIKGESRAGLHPIQAWINQFSKQPEVPTTGGRLTVGDRLNLLIEGTFGVPAEAMLRGLGAGDVAFREAAKSRAVATELELKGVPREQWRFAQKFPELFLDEAALQRIQAETLQAVFQRPSRTLNVITNWIRGRGEWFDLAVATVAPYKMTPWNIVGEILSYNPLVAAARSVNDFRTGNRRSAKLNAGKYVVGSMLTAAGWWLYKNGLMSPSLDQRDEAQKARILSGEVLPPNHINLSGLKRAMTGGDPSFRKGDETADVFRAGGLAGSMFYMTANIGRDFERMPEVKDQEVIGAILRQSTLEQARFGMNQSFLSGVEGLLSAIREGNTDNYVRQWANTVASVPLPNSLTVLSRATREYKPDFREDTFKNQVENIARNKLGFAKMDDYLPLKRGLWGEPLRETPEGRNALIYHFFDVFKNKQVTGDPVPLELFRLWRKTTDTRVIPSLPEKTLTIGGNTYALNAEQQSRYAELVGQSRRRIVDAVVVNPEFHKIPDEAKINVLDKIYDAGMKQGKAQFWNEFGGRLEIKPVRAGFAPGTPQ